MTKTDLFNVCLAVLFHVEGGKANDKTDPGGPTNLGVSLRYLQKLGAAGDLNGDGVVDEDDIDLVTHAVSSGWYKTDFWMPCRCDDLPPALALCVFDMAVNSGPSVAVKTLQRAVRVNADGKVGPQTLAAVNRLPLDYVMSRFFLYRDKFCRGLRNWESAGDGWQRRWFIVAFNAGIINTLNFDNA